MPLTFCPLFSGSSGNALFIGAGDTRILIDAGMTGKALINALCWIGVAPESLSAILITHEHSDHIKGAGIMSRKFNLPVYANEGTWLAMEDKLGDVALRNRRVFETGQDFYIDEVDIQPFSIPHDASDPVGFALHHRGMKVATATDIGHIAKDWIQAVAGAQVLMLEANHDLDMLMQGSYPGYLKSRIRGRKGHLCNEDSGKALITLAQSGVRQCVLGHLSRENNLPDLALRTVCEALQGEGIRPGEDLMLDVALRDRPSGLYTLR